MQASSCQLQGQLATATHWRFDYAYRGARGPQSPQVRSKRRHKKAPHVSHPSHIFDIGYMTPNGSSDQLPAQTPARTSTSRSTIWCKQPCSTWLQVPSGHHNQWPTLDCMRQQALARPHTKQLCLLHACSAACNGVGPHSHSPPVHCDQCALSNTIRESSCNPASCSAEDDEAHCLATAAGGMPYPLHMPLPRCLKMHN